MRNSFKQTRSNLKSSWGLPLYRKFFPMLIILATGVSFITETKAIAESSEFCNELAKTTIHANAGTWSNFRNRPGSIRFEIGTILRKGFSEQKLKLLTITSIPEGRLHGYDDENHCQRLFSETKTSPLKYSSKSLDSLKSLSTWISDFSQGDNEAGEILYEECDKSCSPQYSYTIKAINSEYKVDAEVICGHARDKSKNTYTLRASCTENFTK